MSAQSGRSIWSWLDNATVAAFAGAFFAFLLVILTDGVRRRLRKGRLRFLVSDIADVARQKTQTVRSNLDMLRNNQVTDAPIMGFPIDVVRKLHLDVVDLLSASDNQALHAVVYWSEAVDDLLAKATQKAVEIKLAGKNNLPTAHRKALGQEMIDILEDAEINLGYLTQLAEWYASGETYKILEFQHQIRGPRVAEQTDAARQDA